MELIRRTPHGSCFTYQTTFRLTHPVSAVCIALGQHTRAGIEDNLWNTTKGVRMSTIEMIERHVRMANELGRPIATPEQARERLKIGVTYKSTEETLANLGIPPNRMPGHMGFMVHQTDGKFHPAQLRAGADTSMPEIGRNKWMRLRRWDRCSQIEVREATKMESESTPGDASAADQPQETGPWEPALAQLSEWDPMWAATYLRMTMDPWTRKLLSPRLAELIGVLLNAACANLNPHLKKQ